MATFDEEIWLVEDDGQWREPQTANQLADDNYDDGTVFGVYKLDHVVRFVHTPALVVEPVKKGKK